MVENTDQDIPDKPAAPIKMILTVVVVAIVFFSIGYVVHPNSGTNTTTTTTNSSGNVTITFYESLAPSEASYFQNVIVPNFETANPNITVAFANLPSGAVPNEVTTLEKSGSVGPTIVGLDNLAVGQLLYSSSGNLLMNLTSISSKMMPTTLIPSALNMTNYEKNVFGGIYFMPFRSNIPLDFYNITAFKAAGITAPPTNTSQLMQDAKTLYEHNGNVGQLVMQGAGLSGTHTGSSTGTELYQWMVQYGGNPFTFNDTGDIQAWEYLYNLSTYLSPATNNGYWGTYSGLATGAYSMVDYQWPYVFNLLRNSTYQMSNNSLGVYGGPSGPKNDNHLLGGDVLVLPKGATDLPALETFANYLLSPKVQQQTLVNLSWVAVNAQAYTGLTGNISIVATALQKALNGGIFLRNPTPWITEWNVYASQAWSQIVQNSSKITSYTQIPHILSQYNTQMYNYIKANYGQSEANTYESGGYQPISV